MGLLGWPRRNLLSIKVAVGVTIASRPMTEVMLICIMAIIGIIPLDIMLRYFCRKQAAFFAATITGNEKTGLYVSKDGSQHRKGQSPRMWG